MQNAELVKLLREHATDWDGRQMPDLEPAKCDPTAGTLRQAADTITALQAEVARLREEKEALREEKEAFREGLTFIEGCIASNIKETDDAHGLLVGNERYTGPAVDKIYNILTGIERIARKALEKSND